MPPLQHRFLRQPDFARQLRTWLALQHPTQDQHDMHGGEVATTEDGATVQVINALTPLAAVDGQATPAIYAEEASFVVRCMAVGTLQSCWVEVLLHPGDTLVFIKKVNNRKVHAAQFTSFALFV